LKRRHNYWLYIGVFFVNIIIILIYCYEKHVWAFGEKTLLIGDAGNQYLYVMAELWNKVHNRENIFYSLNACMGYDFYTNFAYYLSSPFNLIPLLFPKDMLEDTIQFVMIVKWACCSVTMAYYVMHTSHNKINIAKNLIAVLFGLAYSLSGYMIAYMFCYNWFDVFILLPIVILSFENMMESKGWFSYYLFLTLCILCNFYMSFLLSIFLLIFFFNQDFSSFVEFKKRGIRFVTTSFLSIVSSGIILLPCLFMVLNRVHESNVDYNAERSNCTLVELITGMYWGTPYAANQGQTPNLFMGCFVLFLIVLGIFSKMRLLIKVKRLMTLMLFGFSYLNPEVNLMWHGFIKPHGYYHRFTYIVIFFAIYMSIELLPQLKYIRVRYIISSLTIIIVGYVWNFFHTKDYYDFYVYLVTLMLLVLYSIILIYYRKGDLTFHNMVKIIFVVMCVEMFSSAFIKMNAYIGEPLEKRNDQKAVIELMAKHHLGDGERITYTNIDSNIGMWIQENSVPGFLSFSNGRTRSLLYKMGVSTFENDASVEYSGGSPVLNLLVNLRYAIGRSSLYFSDVLPVQQEDEISLYQTEHNLGLGYMVDEDIKDWKYNKNNNFENQNEFIKKTTKRDNVFIDLKPDIECIVNGQTVKANAEGNYCYKMIGMFDSVRVRYIVPKNMDLYLYYNNSAFGYCTLRIDDEEKFVSKRPSNVGTVHVGNVGQGQLVELCMQLIGSKSACEQVSFQLANFEENAFLKAFDSLKKNVMQIKQFDSNYIKGVIHVDKTGIMMTAIPYMEGYKVYVDGEKTKILALLNQTFLAIPLESGDHTIVMKYITPGFVGGCVMTCVGVLMTGVLYYESRKSRLLKYKV